MKWGQLQFSTCDGRPKSVIIKNQQQVSALIYLRELLIFPSEEEQDALLEILLALSNNSGLYQFPGHFR